MNRTISIIAVTLAISAGLACKDANQSYITFDAQGTDTKSDTPAADASHDAASEVTGDSPIADAGTDAAPADLATTTDADATDTSIADAASADTESGQ